MIRFNCDYLEGAHPRILQKLTETNLEQTPGYGEDEYCAAARNAIRKRCAAPDADVYFLVGGTQTNLTFLAAALRPYQGVISADTGHINVHETGAIEANGHKVIALPCENGKLRAGTVEACLKAHWESGTRIHEVQPKVIYLSNPTEYGTIYSRAELTALRAVCDRYGAYLYMDGARLGYGMAAEGNDLDYPFLAKVCDAFYIGGTKQGALFGEALVLTNDALKADFGYMLKQKGALLAKGRLLGIQFLELLGTSLYEEISEHAVKQALRIRGAFREKGCAFAMESPTNQQFPILRNADLKKLSEKYAYEVWGAVDAEHTAVRFCASWATKPEDVDALISDIKEL